MLFYLFSFATLLLIASEGFIRPQTLLAALLYDHTTRTRDMPASMKKMLGTGPSALIAPMTGVVPSGARRGYQMAWRPTAAAAVPAARGA